VHDHLSDRRERERAVERGGRRARHQHQRAELLVELLDPRGEIDRIAVHRVGHAVARPDVAGDDLAGVDADAIIQEP
jgi:hypothetical protein